MDEENRGRGIELDDVIHFIVTKKILSAGKTQKNTAFFLRCQNGEQQLQKQRWQKGGGKPKLAKLISQRMWRFLCHRFSVAT